MIKRKMKKTPFVRTEEETKPSAEEGKEKRSSKEKAQRKKKVYKGAPKREKGSGRKFGNPL